MVSLKEFGRKAAVVKSIVKDIYNALPDNEDAEDLERNYDELHSMILDVSETLDCLISDVEK